MSTQRASERCLGLHAPQHEHSPDAALYVGLLLTRCLALARRYRQRDVRPAPGLPSAAHARRGGALHRVDPDHDGLLHQAHHLREAPLQLRHADLEETQSRLGRNL